MAFKDIRFPTGVSFGAVGGPGFSTNILTLTSGVEGVNQNWSQARCSYNVARGCNSEQDKKDLLAFFRIAKGKGNTFRYKDFTDFEVAVTEGKFTALGGSTYQMVKEYSNAGVTDSTREIYLPVAPVLYAGASLLTIGVHYTVVLTTGIVTLVSGSAPTKWSGKFDVLARFDTDTLQLVAEDYQYFKSQNIPVIEVKPAQ